MHREVFVLFAYRIFVSNMLVADDFGDAQTWPSPASLQMQFSLILFFVEKQTLNGFTSNSKVMGYIVTILSSSLMDPTQKLLDISLQFFLQGQVQNVYLKTVPGFVDIPFTSWHKIMKKIKFPSKKSFFKIKSIVFYKLYHISKNAGTVWGATYFETISETKNGNQTSRSGFENKNAKKKAFSQETLKQRHTTKICSTKKVSIQGICCPHHPEMQFWISSVQMKI